MTAQAADGITYQNESYLLCGCNGNALFTPEDYKLNPAPPSTACYRGWMAEFVVTDCLILRDLFVFHDGGLPVKNRSPNGPTINGVVPVKPDSYIGFNCLYKGVNIPVNFTGGLLIAQELIRGLGVNMGYHPFWKFEKVVELIFSDGKLQNAADKSAVAQIVREQHLETGILGRPEVRRDTDTMKWIEECFSLNYNLYG